MMSRRTASAIAAFPMPEATAEDKGPGHLNFTGRLRTKWALIHTDEVYFRDTANGFLAWAVALVISVTFLAGVGRDAGGSRRPGCWRWVADLQSECSRRFTSLWIGTTTKVRLAVVLARPKSRILTTPSGEILMLAGFRSR